MHIEAVDIPDAWFQCLYNIFDYGNKYTIQHGSFVGQIRYEFDWISVLIQNAYAEPYDLMLPQIPSHLNIPNPVEPGYVEQYVLYLMTADKKPDEDYTYGQRLCTVFSVYSPFEIVHTDLNFKCISQIDHFIDVLKQTPNTNQAILQIAQPSDCLLNDPPCLRHIDLKVRDNKLNFYPYFRSWDLWGGFPANLAGIAVLQKYMADEIGIQPGFILASSKGLHIYEYAEELAKIRINKCK
jgi:thymidylate synthase